MQDSHIRFYKICAIVLFAVTLLLMCIIFSLSAQSATESDKNSSGIAYFLTPVIIPHYDELSPFEQYMMCRKVNNITRKVAHFLEYCVLNFVFTIAVYCFFRKKKGGYIWIPYVISTLFACTDEFHQFFVPGRGPGIRDVFIDSMGALAGLGCAVLLLRFVTLIHAKRRFQTTITQSKGDNSL